MQIDASKQVETFKDFIEKNYKARIHELIRDGKKSLVIDFLELSSFDIELSEQLLEEPEETVKAAEYSLGQLDVGESTLNRVRFFNLPKGQIIRIKDIRSAHINKFMALEGIVRQASDVRPHVTLAKFECPSCGNTMTIPQLESTFREPTRCSCGRKGKFRLLSKDLVDIQRLLVEEVPEGLEGGEQAKRMPIFLKEDLVEPKMERKTTPGSKIRVFGVVKEVPLPSKSGGTSTTYDLMIDANFIEPIEEAYVDIQIGQDEVEEIKKLASDPKIYEKLLNSIAPSIYGHNDIKEALVLQLFGGVKKLKQDGTGTRGDMHILLVGDPGCISGDSQVALYTKGMDNIQNLGEYHKQPIREAVVKIRKNKSDKAYDFATVFQHYKQQPVLKVVTETGKEIICTYNQPLLTKNGWVRTDELNLGTKIRVMPKIPNYIKKLVPTNFTRVKKTFGGLKEVSLPENFTEDLASLCGYIIGDGNIHSNGYRVTCYINNQETDIMPTIINLWKNTFCIEPRIFTNNPSEHIKTIEDENGLLRQFISTQEIHYIEINSRQVAQSLLFLANKRVPQEIFKSPKKVISKFISWLFEADGCAFGNGRGRTSIQLKSASPNLLKDVQLLLLYFGIQGRLIEDNLCIRRSRDMELFAKHIGFNSYKKKIALEKVLESIKQRENANKRKTPQRYERVTEVIPFGFRDVYDFEVPLSHSFVANGIVCHNSGKSATLQFISKAAPKGRFVSGRGASGAGITATVVKDEFIRGWALEAGAMVLANKGICVIDELDKMSPEDRSALHEAMEQQCYHYDTIISLADGTEIKIGEFVEKLLEKNKDKIQKGKDCLILPYDKDEIFTTDFKKVYKTKLSKVSKHKAFDKFIKIKFSHGREITVTPEHPVFTAQNGKIVTLRADQIQIGYPIPIPLSIPIEGQEQYFDFSHNIIKNDKAKIHIKIPQRNGPELFKILGYLISEGSREINRGKYNGINFTNSNLEVLDDFENNMKIVFNLSPYKQLRIDDHAPRYCYRYISTEIFNFMKATSPEILTLSGQKQIPGWAMKGKKDDIAKMLSTLFEGDGYAAIKKRTIRIGYKTKSKRLAQQIQDLLLRFEIRSSITSDREYYRVGITSYNNIKKFSESIGFITQSKNNIIAKYLKEKKVIRVVKNKIPIQFNDAIINIIKEESIKKVSKYKIYDIIYDHKKRKKPFTFSVPFLKNLLKQIKIEKNRDYLKDFTQNIGWEYVTGIEIIENDSEPWAYDVTVEPHHTFISQATILHNTVTISKANIQATLRAETTILAAANPKLGRFDPYQPIAAQIDLPPTLINRFDLIFPVKDVPNKELDERIAKHVLASHQEPKTFEPEIPISFLKKYISYVRQNIFPILSESAIEEITTFYVGLRNSATSSGENEVKPIPITARQLEALIRLSEASARVRLSDKVLRKDAKRAIDLLKHCLMEVGMDKETGQLDIDRISTGITATTRSKIMTLREIINELEGRFGKTIPLDQVVAEASKKGIEEDKVEEIVESLKRSGDLFEPKRGFIQKI